MRFDQPLFFGPNRVWRCYTGGRLMDRFLGNPAGPDGHTPEDWLASVVHAENAEHSQGPEEGLARLRGPDGAPGPLLADVLASRGAELLGAKHVARHGATLGVLCKYLDSAVRLPIQCHPDVEAARRLYRSPYGKTESWYILDTRAIGGQRPYLLMGFKPGITPAAFAAAVAAGDSPAMEAMLHKVHCAPGDMYLIPGRFPHAIGPGVFMLETQEPSDWVIQPERTCADMRLSEATMWGPLTPEQGLGVFDYAGMTEAEMLGSVRVAGRRIAAAGGGTLEELIGPAHTPAFGVQRATIAGRMPLPPLSAFAIAVVAAGEGTLEWDGGGGTIRRGDYALLPASCPPVTAEARGTPLVLLLCLPPAA